MRIRRAVVVCSALLLGARRSGDAQRVRGIVRDSVSDQPVAGAVVWLTDSAGRMLARSIGDGAGKFAVPRIFGAARLHVIHIGYRPRDVPISGSPADTVYDVSLNALPPLLETVRTSSSRVCPGADDGAHDAAGQSALDLWEQARTALLATVVAREAGAPRLQMLRFEQGFEPVRRRATGAITSSRYVVGDKPYVAGRPSWAFVDEGYMTEEPGGARTFYAPDEDVLLDRRFAETHCLHVMPPSKSGTAHVNDVGLAFEPAADERRDTLVDISGVLWIDKHLSALESIEFKYTGLERAADRSDGTIVFQVMPSGAPMIQSWTIRSTIIAIDAPANPSGVRRHEPDRKDRTNVRTLGYREEGGILAEALWSDGTRWHADFPRITGVVVDSVDRPLSGMRVWLSNTADTAVSGADGRFELPYVFPGIYSVLASDSVLASKGITRIVPRTYAMYGADVGKDSATATTRFSDVSIVLRLRPRSDALASVCPSGVYRPGTGVILADVIGGDGGRVAGARVDIETLQSIVAGDTLKRSVKLSGESSPEGRFIVCGASLDQPLLVRATKDGQTAETAVREWGDGVVTVSLVLRPKAGEQ